MWSTGVSTPCDHSEIEADRGLPHLVATSPGTRGFFRHLFNYTAREERDTRELCMGFLLLQPNSDAHPLPLTFHWPEQALWPLLTTEGWEVQESTWDTR